MHSIKHFYFLLIYLLMSVFLSSCGSKGDLYQVIEPETEQNITVKEPQKNSKDIKKKST